MQRDHEGTPDPEPHVFDQTNGVVDLGADPPRPIEGGEQNRAASGIAMLSTQKP